MKKKAWLFVLLVLLLLICGGGGWIYYVANARYERPKAHATINEPDRKLLKDGDLILRRGEGLVSDQIAYILKTKPFDVTHSGIISVEHDSIFVVHSIADKEHNINGVIKQTLSDFLLDSRANSIITLRYKDMDAKRTEFMARTQYYLRKSPPFDYGFDIYDSTSIYCAELIWRLFNEVYQVDVFPDKLHMPNTDLLQYSCLFKGDNFTFIINQQAKTCGK